MSANLEKVVRRLRELKDEKERIAARETEINKEITGIEQQKLPEMMEAAGITSFKVPGIGSVSTRNETFVNVLAENRPKLIDWLKESGNGSLVAETVNHNTLQSFVREQLEAATDIPDFIKLTHVKTAKLRRS